MSLYSIFYFTYRRTPHHFPLSDLPGILSLVFLIFENEESLSKLVFIERLQKSCQNTFDELIVIVFCKK